MFFARRPPKERSNSKVMDDVSGNRLLKESRKCQDREAGHCGVSTFARGKAGI